MASSNAQGETYKKVKTILVSQPKPERSPYYDLERKFNLQIDWRPFIHVEPLTPKEFRRQRIKIDDHTAIIFTSKNSIDHFFKVCEEARVFMSAETKYFCKTESIANYLQKFIVYRKRKVFAGKRSLSDLKTYFIRHKEEKFLLPCSNLGAKKAVAFLESINIEWQEAVMYRTVASDLSDLEDVFYDVLVFFSPSGIESLYENFPEFKQNDTRIAVFGSQTVQAVEDRGLTANIQAPAPEVPSMTSALKNYLNISNKE